MKFITSHLYIDMEVTAFIIELSAEVVKGIQGGNECWMGNNEKLRGEELEGMDVLLRGLVRMQNNRAFI